MTFFLISGSSLMIVLKTEGVCGAILLHRGGWTLNELLFWLQKENENGNAKFFWAAVDEL